MTPIRRRLLFVFATLLAGALLLVVTLPWWLGLALRNAGPRWGLKVGAYERLGYARFAARDVEYRRGNVRVTAARVEGRTPVVWLWRRGEADAVVEHWAVNVEPQNPAASTPSTTTRARGWMPLRTTLRRVAAGLDRWLPRAKLGEGTVRWPGGGLSLASATWERRTLTTRALTFGTVAMDATVELPAAADELRLRVKLMEQGGATVTDRTGSLAGEITWWEQRAALTARFGAEGWMPAEASLQADSWTVPAALLKLGELYSEVRGRGRIDWSERALRGEIAVAGEPLADKKAPPLEATLRGRGDLQTFTVEALHATLPGVVADLSAPVTVERSGKFRESPARFALQVDLAKQPWFTARGTASVEAVLNSGVATAPTVEFRATASDIVAEGLAVARVQGAGKFAWPRVQVTALTVAGPGGEQLNGSGGWDFHTREIFDAAIDGEIRRTTLARWLPAQPEFTAIRVKARAGGSPANLKHEGEASAADVTFRSVKPLAVTFAWNGTGAALENFSATAATAAAKLSMAGALGRESVQLRALELTQNGAEPLRLVQPATIRWRPELRVEGVKLTSARGGIDADLVWGPAGRVALALRGVSSAWLENVIAVPGPAWELNTATLTGAWDRGAMTFTTSVDAAIALGDERKAMVTLAARGDKDGVRVEALRVADGAEMIVNTTGRLPVILTPGGTTWGRIDPQAAVVLDMETTPNATFWRELTKLTGVELKEPNASAHVKGTWERPIGEVRLQAARLAVDAARFKHPLPALEALEVVLSGDRSGVRLERLAVRVEGQAVSARGRLPVAAEGWAKIFKEPLTLARRDADLRLEMPDVDVAAFARFLPGYLAPKGRLNVDVGYKDGAFDGSVKLRGAATRLLGPLGVLQEIDGDLSLAARTLELKSVTAQSGGQEVRLTGRVELPEAAAGAKSPTTPKFDLALKGTNLPFVRRTGLLLRADLDLKLATPTDAEPRLTGTVRLRDSLFLQDIRALLPSGAQSAARRPPYFALENAPLDAWRIDVDVEGDRFMRLRTTVFNGVASARFHIGGTLGEPVAIGEATIDEGKVLLPFATFDVQEGRVTLTREQPYEPQLWLAGQARRYNYDLRMELSGAATAPLLTFSSSPPLEHGQVLLMVMAGEAPRNEVNYTGGARAAKFGAFVGQSLLASFGDPDNADRLTIATGEKVSRQGRETYQMEYRLSEKWSVTGEIDEFDDYNAAVKWRVYSRGGRKEEGEKNEAEKH